jgi:hypothetical protein
MARRGSASGPQGSKFVRIVTWVIAIIVIASMVLALLPLGQQ